MTNINDVMQEMFKGKTTKALGPHVALEGFSFRLLNIEPNHKWVATGEVKPDGTMKYAQDPDMIIDETGERAQMVVELQLITPDGLTTSAVAPFVDRRHYFDVEKTRALIAAVGSNVELVNPRIEFKESSTTNSNGFSKIETKMYFAFDDIEVPNED